MRSTCARLRDIPDDFEWRGKQATSQIKKAEMVDVAVKARFLISEIAGVFEAAEELEAS